ncbi:MAG: TIGR02757 family protein [Bacteroidales bacterium]|jgi:uncharacterized protein (TIGR02757 family)|nr:TIGR02757 family protein [Bacteroidales bacterium]
MQNLKTILDERLNSIRAEDFIPFDPISIPHRFSRPEDVELSGFLTALLSWGRRDMIIRAADNLLRPMGGNPHDFLLNASEKQLQFSSYFKYRTMNSEDACFLLKSLQSIYRKHQSLQYFFIDKPILDGLYDLRTALLAYPHEKRSEKHIANVRKKAAAKRLNMFLRWMIRRDEKGIDFGIWENIPTSQLIIPLDVHTANSARFYGLTTRKQNDLHTALEITEQLRKFDVEDPVKYDLALFLNDNPK